MGGRLRGNVHGKGVLAGHHGVARGTIERPAPHGQRGQAQGGGLSRMFLTTSRETVGHFDQNGRDVRGRSLQCFLQLAGGREVPVSTAAINVRKRAKRDKQGEKPVRLTASV
jgi:hypothetical protein